MTIMEAINWLDGLKANTYTVEDKVAWLSRLDGRIYEEIISTHVGCCMRSFSPYSSDDTEEELIAEAPHDEMYIRWLEAQIDYANGEYNKYNNSITAFNAAYQAFADYYNRTHLPKRRWVRYK